MGKTESDLSICCVSFQHWFTELPPVLTFELSRFEFNQALGRPEKIHNKLEFPQVLYLDRYGLQRMLQFCNLSVSEGRVTVW